jgi:hypothetical protein
MTSPDQKVELKLFDLINAENTKSMDKEIFSCKVRNVDLLGFCGKSVFGVPPFRLIAVFSVRFSGGRVSIVPIWAK